MEIEIGALYKSAETYAFVTDVKENKVYYTILTTSFYYKASHGMEISSFIDVFKYDYKKYS